MAYNLVSPSHCPYARDSAKFFSQELIEHVLFEFGHIWKPERSRREVQLRKVASFVFSPPIGRLVAYISRKYSGFVVMKALKSWNYVNAHRPSMRERLLCNEIVTFCTRHELDDDDLGLYTFLAIVAEYARLVITFEQERLIDTVVDALRYCLTNVLDGGFVHILDRLKSRASKFEYPPNYVICDYDRQTGFLSPVNTEPFYTPRSEFHSPIMLDFNLPVSLHTSPPEDITTELKNRKVHSELFKRKMMTDHETQTEIKSDHSINQLRSFVLTYENTDFVEKVIMIENDDSDGSVPEATFMLVDTSDVSLQTWSSGEQFESLQNETDETKEEQTSKGECSASKHSVDLTAVIEKLKKLENLPTTGPLPDRSRVDLRVIEVKKPEDKKCMNEAKKLSVTLPTDYVMPLELDKQSFVSAPCRNPESLLQSAETEHFSEKGTSSEVSLHDSQFGSLDVTTDDLSKLCDERNYSFDSQIGSLDTSTRTSDDSRLEN